MRRFAIVNDSMEPALQAGDWVVARRVRGVPSRGAIVVFEHTSRPGLAIVKRVVGLPLEEVALGGGRVHINGTPLVAPLGSVSDSSQGTWTVPAGSVWVLGDNRAVSAADSRALGPISVVDVGWKVVARYWPRSRAGFVSST